MTMTADRQDTSRARAARRGSAQSDRQVAYAVRDGKAVTATLATGEKITGFVFGADDYHWSIVAKSGDVFLVHKSSPALKIHSESTIETATAAIQKMVAVFRSAVLRDHFNHTPPSRQQKD